MGNKNIDKLDYQSTPILSDKIAISQDHIAKSTTLKKLADAIKDLILGDLPEKLDGMSSGGGGGVWFFLGFETRLGGGKTHIEDAFIFPSTDEFTIKPINKNRSWLMSPTDKKAEYIVYNLMTVGNYQFGKGSVFRPAMTETISIVKVGRYPTQLWQNSPNYPPESGVKGTPNTAFGANRWGQVGGGGGGANWGHHFDFKEGSQAIIIRIK